MHNDSWDMVGGNATVQSVNASSFPPALFKLKDEQEGFNDWKLFIENMPIELFGFNWASRNECLTFFASLNLSELVSYSYQYFCSLPGSGLKMSVKERIRKTFSDVIVPAYGYVVRIYEKTLYVRHPKTGEWIVCEVPSGKDYDSPFKRVIIDYKRDYGRRFEFSKAIEHLFGSWMTYTSLGPELADMLVDMVTQGVPSDSDTTMFGDALMCIAL